MGKFSTVSTGIDGLIVIEPLIFGDDRGYFMETWNFREFKAIGLDMCFVQDNQSKSKQGVLRGLHYQKTKPQGKLVRVLTGEVFDVAVDIREKSASFGKWFGILLNGENKKQLYIPGGFAHGFLVMSDTAVFSYKCTDYYEPTDEGGIIWNDPDIGIEWPILGINLILSEKDQRHPGFSSI